MGLGSFLLGGGGGVPKNVKRRLYGAYDRYAGEDVPQDELDFIRQSVKPVFERARRATASRYANADAPIVSGGRTQELIGLAGEEAGAIGQMTQELKERRRRRAQEYLQILLQGTYKAPSSGLIPSLAPGAGAFFGAGGLDLLKKKPQAATYV